MYNITLQKELEILLFKVNYSYKLRIFFITKKKSSKIAKERVETLIHFYKELRKLVKLV